MTFKSRAEKLCQDLQIVSSFRSLRKIESAFAEIAAEARLAALEEAKQVALPIYGGPEGYNGLLKDVIRALKEKK